jgi:hypothetical protein
MAYLFYRNSELDEWHGYSCPLSGRTRFDDSEAIFKARQFIFAHRVYETKAFCDKGELIAHWKWNDQVREPQLIGGKDPTAP